MVYSTTAKVKSVVWIDGWHADTQFDDFITICIAEANAEVDSKLRDYISVPLGGSEEDYNMIVSAESYLAAGKFRLTRDEGTGGREGVENKGTMLLEEGRKLLEMYIEEHFIKPKADMTTVRDVIHQKSDKFWEV